MNTKTKKIKPFYEVKIPSDWEEKKLGELFDFKNGINAGKSSYGSGVRFINVMEIIYNDSITPDKIPGKIQVSSAQKQQYLVKNGDVLFNRTSETTHEIGLTAVYQGEEEVIFGGFVIRGRSLDKTIDDDFKKYCFRTKKVRDQIIKSGQGAVRTNIGQGDLEKVEILLPPLPEQHAIANLLKTWDEVIRKTQVLIVQKELRKKWLMQNLLTGKKRLKGFKEEWNEVRLKEVCNLINGMAFKPEDWVYKGLPIIRIQNLNGSNEYNYYNKKINEKYVVQNGDLLFAWSGSRGTSFGAFKWFGQDAVLNQHIFNVHPKSNLEKNFAFHILKWLTIGIERRAHGSAGLVHVTKKQLEHEIMKIPNDIKEQTAIAQVLQSADTEIQLLKTKVEKLKEQKKWLMQVLLTGEKRLTIKLI